MNIKITMEDTSKIVSLKSFGELDAVIGRLFGVDEYEIRVIHEQGLDLNENMQECTPSLCTHVIVLPRDTKHDLQVFMSGTKQYTSINSGLKLIKPEEL
jgi:hypothetical protein